MLRDLLLVLGDFGNAGVRRPVGGGRVKEGHVDVRVVVDLVELVRHLVRDKDQGHLRR